MGHDEQIWSAEDRVTKKFDYNPVFSYIKDIVSEADIAIANLEVTLAGPPYKGYPQFSSPAALAAACKEAGFDGLVTANNHSADRGKSGILNTILRLDSIGIPHTGTFVSQMAKDTLEPLYFVKNGIKIALLNYTYGTNGIAVPAPVIVNLLDRNNIAAGIASAKKASPDFIILFLHWGTEYDTVPRREQYELADFCFSQGADLIIGSHPHVVQKMVWQKDDGRNRAVVYSLGNFISNQRKTKTDGGAMARIELTKKGGITSITNTGYYLTWVYTPIVSYRKKFYILPCSQFEVNRSFFASPADFSQMELFIRQSRELFMQNVNVNEIKFDGNDWLLNN
jgi:poly-gamma-glutamate synthesis protein (capsule biosynthesis protein)